MGISTNQQRIYIFFAGYLADWQWKCHSYGHENSYLVGGLEHVFFHNIWDNPSTTAGWWLTYPSEKYESQWDGLSLVLWKITNVWNHQPVSYGHESTYKWTEIPPIPKVGKLRLQLWEWGWFKMIVDGLRWFTMIWKTNCKRSIEQVYAWDYWISILIFMHSIWQFWRTWMTYGIWVDTNI